MRSTKVTTLTAESIEAHRNWCIGRGQSENTAKAYSTDLRMLLMHHKLTEIPESQFDQLAQVWLNQTRLQTAPKTTGRRLTSLRGFAKWATWETDLTEYKAPTPSKTIPHPIPEGLQGLERLLQVARTPEQKALIGACGFIGLRIGEALAFRTSWLSTFDMTLRVRGKGDKERVVPVSPRAWEAVSLAFIDAMQGDGYLVHYEDRSARKVITSLGSKAGLHRKISSHDLRATYATIMLDNGANIRVVQELLGHSSVATTEIYTGVGTAALKQAVNF